MQKEKKRKLPFKHGLRIDNLCCCDSLFCWGSPRRSSHRSIPLIPINSFHSLSSFFLRLEFKRRVSKAPTEERKKTQIQKLTSEVWFVLKTKGRDGLLLLLLCVF
jgi:hypothetical protein